MVKKTSKTSEKKVEKAKTVKKKESKKKAVSKRAAKVKNTEPSAQEISADKKEIIEKFQLKKGDTGSPEVQIGLLTSRIEKLVKHLKENPSDNHSRRGLLGIVSKRRRLLNYLEKKEVKRYKSIAKSVGLLK